MLRSLVRIALAAMALPGVAAAQEAASLPQARLSLTPIVGVRGSLLTGYETPIIVRGALGATAVSLEPQRGPSAVAGAEVDLRLAGRVGVAGALMFTNPDPFVLTMRSGSHIVSQLRLSGPSVWLARAGLSYRLPEIPRPTAVWPQDRRTRPAGYLVAGPALLRQDFRDSPLDHPDLEDRVDSWAVHVGYRALFPIGTPNLALQVMLEDYLPFWNRRGEQRRVERILGLEPGGSDVVSADLGYDRSHIPMLTVGLGVRF